MTLRQLRDIYVSRLEGLYPSNEAISIFDLVCEDLLQMTKSDIMIRGAEDLIHLREEILLKTLEKLIAGKPVQHLTGISHFYGHQFMVNEHTLIPRQETEELVHWIITDYKAKSIASILDIGSGSGCIGISISAALSKTSGREKSMELTLLDRSEKAMEVARLNAKKIIPEVTTHFEIKDVFSIQEIESYTIIVSNPPYVRELEKKDLHTNVLDHEPHTALFVSDQDPLVYYRKILEYASKIAQPVIYFEINQYLATDMSKLADQLHYQFVLKKDLNNNYRMMKCWK